MKTKSLKAKNQRLIRCILIFDAATILMSFFWDNVSSFNAALSLLSIGNATLLSIVSFVSFAAVDIIPVSIKTSLVFWRLQNPLPGARAFTKLIYKDARINPAVLKKKLRTFPTDPREQNALWYKIYKKHQADTTVCGAHQKYLLYRDVSSVSLLMLIILTLLILTNNFQIGKLEYTAILLISQYLLTMVCSRNSANRFVQTVLAIESTGITK